jgi:hypothetical protein
MGSKPGTASTRQTLRRALQPSRSGPSAEPATPARQQSHCPKPATGAADPEAIPSQSAGQVTGAAHPSDPQEQLRNIWVCVVSAPAEISVITQAPLSVETETPRTRAEVP